LGQEILTPEKKYDKLPLLAITNNRKNFPLSPAAIRATLVNTREGGGFAATNVSFRWAIVLSIA
jgi:hypothetical protein